MTDLKPRNYQETKARVKAGQKPAFVMKKSQLSGPRIRAFNGSQTSRKNKKRPITLPEHA